MAYKFRENQSASLHSGYMMMPGNWTVWHSNDGHWHYGEVKDSDRARNGWHAGYYVIVVILVYGMSIIMLIASHINQNHRKLLEDRQIDKYLKEFQVVKERSSRDSYRNLKKAIVAKLHRGGSGGGGGGGVDRSSNSSACLGGKVGGIYRCISRSVLPLTALVFPSGLSTASDDVGLTHPISASRETLQATKEKSRNDTCLCNLYVIEEFEGEQKQSRSPAEETTVTQVNENDNQRCQREVVSRRAEPAGRDASQFKQLPVSQQSVKAEINIPPSVSRSRASSDVANRYSPVGETAGDIITVDRYDVPVVHGRCQQGEGTPSEFKKTAEPIHRQNVGSAKVGKAFGDSLFGHSQINLTPAQLHSPKRPLPSSRSPSGSRERHVYGSSTGHRTDDIASRSSHSSSICSRSTNPVQISSV